MKTIFLENGSTTIEQLNNPKVRSNLKRDTYHIALRVENIETEYIRNSKLLSQEILPPRETGDTYREFVVIDPEGNIIEFVKRVKEKPINIVKGVVFDFDGTIVDSEPNWFRADRELLGEFGINLTFDMKKRYIGGSSHDMITDLIERYNLEASIDNLLKRKNELYLKYALEETIVFPEMVKLLNYL